MIYLGSRYEKSDVQYILDARTHTTRPTVMRGPFFPPSPVGVYRWRQGDRMDLVGKRFTDTANTWWRIVDRNSEYIDPLSLQPGSPLVIR